MPKLKHIKHLKRSISKKPSIKHLEVVTLNTTNTNRIEGSEPKMPESKG